MSRPRIYTPEEIRERRRLRGIEYRKRNKDKIRAYKQRPEVRERRKAEHRKWRENHHGYYTTYNAAHSKHRAKKIPLTEEERIRRRRESKLAWDKRNKEKVRESKIAWNKRNKEKLREIHKKWRERNKERVNAYAREYRKKKRSTVCKGYKGGDSFVCKHCGVVFHRTWSGRGRMPCICTECRRKQNAESYKRYERRHPQHAKTKRIMEEMRLMTDHEAYAHHRALQRERGRKMRDRMRAAGTLPPRKKNGGMYKPYHSRRFPDWCVKMQKVLDVRSPFLIENRTDEQRAYVRELAIERRKKMECR